MSDYHVFFRFPMPHGEITACARFVESLTGYSEGQGIVTAPGWSVGLAFCTKEDYGLPRKIRRQIGRNLAAKRHNLAIRAEHGIRPGALRLEVLKCLEYGPHHWGVFHYSGPEEKGRFKPFVEKALEFFYQAQADKAKARQFAIDKPL